MSDPPERVSERPRRQLQGGFHEALSGDPIALEDTYRRRQLSLDRYLPFAGAPEPPPPPSSSVSQEHERITVRPPARSSGEYRFLGVPRRR